MQFDDIYFSPEDGLAETGHVFIGGNGLPAAWVGHDIFTIVETGFGTGLNFLAAWQLFDRSAQPDQKLHYVSFEKYPLSWDEIFRALAPWHTEFGGRLDRLRALYPLRVPGFHRIALSEQVTLTLIFDDVNDALPQLVVPYGVDAWFLDGFAPSKNPDMWSDLLFAQMARLSHGGSTFATFTVAGVVRRGLEEVGFSIEKKKGFGRKNEMLRGTFNAGRPLSCKRGIKKVAIIGGGLAGSATAFVLKRRGVHPVVFEKNEILASGASGNICGLYNPRLSAQRTPESDFYTAAFAQAVRTLSELQCGYDIDFNPCGSLHLITSADREKKFSSALQNWGWHKSHMHLLDSEAASQRAGIALENGALCLPDSGTVSPVALCHAYTDDLEVRLGAKPNAEDISCEFDAVVFANGAAVTEFSLFADLPIHTVRGQVTHFEASHETFDLRMNLCFGGYLSPQRAGGHILGATFQRWMEDSDVKDEDHEENFLRLSAAIPQLKFQAVTGGRTGLRSASKDMFPIIGHVADNIYVSTAHASHGIISTLAGAHMLADIMVGDTQSLSRDSVKKLAPGRFAERAAKKGK